MTKILTARPKLVLTMTENDQMTNLEYDESILFPWIVLTNHHKVSITCPSCGIIHYGMWNKNLSDRSRGIGSFTKNFQQPLCCNKLRGKSLTIGYTEHCEFWWSMFDNKTINSTMYEGFIMDSFIKKHQANPTFVDEDNDDFVEDDLEVRVEFREFRPGRYLSFPLYFHQVNFVMKAPSKVPPYDNLINTMDTASWIFVFVSLVSVSLALVIIVRVGSCYGIPQPDLVRIILTPFSMMTSEKMPSWFDEPHPTSSNRSLVEVTELIPPSRQGRAGKLLLLMWSVMGMVIMFGFSCNLRAIYMRVDYETPLDTAEQIYMSDKTYYETDYNIDRLKAHNNPWMGKFCLLYTSPSPRDS